MLGFNDGIIPRYEQDTKYITDNISNIIGINNTKIINKNIHNNTINAIKDNKNWVITYNLRDFKNS